MERIKPLKENPQVAFILTNVDISIYIILSALHFTLYSLLFTLSLPDPICSSYEAFIIHNPLVGK